jgi:hypothetical protein
MAEDLITLILPPGAEAGKVSHGDREWIPYRLDHTDPGSKWAVEVPKNVAYHLCRVGGFVLLEDGR